MNKIFLPRDFIYEFNGDKNLINEYLNQCLSADINYSVADSSMPHSSSVGYPIPFNNKLQDWLNSCVNEVSQEYFNLADNAKLIINDMWITKTNFLQSGSPHLHSLSIFSGLLYLHDSNIETTFYVEDELVKRYISFFGLVCKKSMRNTFTVKPETGKLLIWPSYLQHKISPNNQKNTRYTVAFNTFFDGAVSTVDTQRLSIKTEQSIFLPRG